MPDTDLRKKKKDLSTVAADFVDEFPQHLKRTAESLFAVLSPMYWESWAQKAGQWASAPLPNLDPMTQGITSRVLPQVGKVASRAAVPLFLAQNLSGEPSPSNLRPITLNKKTGQKEGGGFKDLKPIFAYQPPPAKVKPLVDRPTSERERAIRFRKERARRRVPPRNTTRIVSGRGVQEF